MRRRFPLLSPRLYLSLILASCVTACGPDEGATVTPEPTPDEDASGLMPQDPVERAAVLAQRGDFDQAIAELDKAIAGAPDDHELHYARGVLLRQAGQYDAAVAAWRLALEKSPDFFAAHNGIGAIRLEQGAFEEAAQAAAEAARLRPDFADAHYNLGVALAGLNKLAQARQSLDLAAGLAGSDPMVWAQLAIVAERQGDRKRADQALEKARALGAQSADAQFAVARIAQSRGDRPAALEALRLAVQLDATFDAAAMMLGRALARGTTGAEVAEGRQVLEALAKRRPEDARVWSELGGVRAKVGRLEEALKALDRALSLEAGLTSAHVRRSGVLAELGRCDDATKAARGTPKPGRKAATAAIKRCGG